jgi:hypothetical protein
LQKGTTSPPRHPGPGRARRRDPCAAPTLIALRHCAAEPRLHNTRVPSHPVSPFFIARPSRIQQFTHKRCIPYRFV